ncbi:golgin subfamily A member 6-like protein 24 [Parasteatoda tepidariorum]|uniref:golgin subfamily A member 6-like protein 24 n=1 Tax=Parasteatoda tepidariorum TaxID=114398 RepID=UPI0039BC3A79
MSFFGKAKKEDLIVLAKEFGKTVPENVKLFELKAWITGRSDYDEQYTKEVLSGIKEERERKQEREREDRERKREDREWEREERKREQEHAVRMQELQKLIDDRKRGTRKLTEDREREKQKLKEDREHEQQKLKEDREREDKIKRQKEQELELREGRKRELHRRIRELEWLKRERDYDHEWIRCTILGIERLTEILMEDQDEESKTQDFKPLVSLNESVECLGAVESAERPESGKFGFGGKEVNVKGGVRQFPEWSGPNVNRKGKFLRESQRKNSTSSGEWSPKCYKCGEVGHLKRGCPKITRFRLDQKKDQAKQDSVERVIHEKRMKKDESDLRRIEVVEEKFCFSKIIYSVPNLSISR